MNQITIRELRRSATEEKLKEWMPCQVVSDGKVVAVLVPQDVALANPVMSKSVLRRVGIQSPDVAQPGRFSKEAQAKGVMGCQ